MLALGGDLFERRGAVAVLVQVADDAVGGVADFFVSTTRRQLRMQVIGQRDRRGEEGFKRGLFDDSDAGLL